MPSVNDSPNVIYVRGINGLELKAFQEIKSSLGLTSNSETIKKLFTEYISLLKSYDQLKKGYRELEKKNEIMEEKLSAVKDFAVLLNNL